MRLLAALLVCSLTVSIAPSSRLGKNFTVVVDCSGSMAAHIHSAVGAYSEIASQPVDDMTLRVIGFDSDPHLWPGGRVDLPDKEKVDQAADWLVATASSRGGTYVIPAIKIALAEKKRELTVILITDGAFMECPSSVLGALREGQDRRKSSGLDEAVIAVVHIAPSHQRLVLKQIAEAGKGGLYQ